MEGLAPLSPSPSPPALMPDLGNYTLWDAALSQQGRLKLFFSWLHQPASGLTPLLSCRNSLSVEPGSVCRCYWQPALCNVDAMPLSLQICPDETWLAVSMATEIAVHTLIHLSQGIKKPQYTWQLPEHFSFAQVGLSTTEKLRVFFSRRPPLQECLQSLSDLLPSYQSARYL